ncbi:MAG TPA: FHA domain-containing protein, partial [Vicinamibacteria bacterium]|nr:FHA domain-containing protein [Vicinamibacteria bacterium]
MADEKRRLVSLTVVGGPLEGQSCRPDEVVGELLIGSDPECQLVLDLPGISPVHARLWTDLDSVTIRDTHAPSGVFLNDTRVEADLAVGEHDLIWLGQPGAPDSVCLRPAFAPWVEVLPFTPSDDPFYVGEEAASASPGSKPTATPELPAVASTAVPPAPALSPAVAVSPGDQAEPEPMLLVQDDLAALAGAVAAEEPLVDATEATAEPEVDPHDDFFVAEEPKAAAPPGTAQEPPPRPSGTAPVTIVQPPSAAAAAPQPRPATVVKPTAVAKPAIVAKPSAVAHPPAVATPAVAPKPVTVVLPTPPTAGTAAPQRGRPPESSPDRTTPHLARAAVAAARRPPAAAARAGGRAGAHRPASGNWVRPVAIGLGGLVLVAAGVVGWRLWAAGTVRLEAVT